MRSTVWPYLCYGTIVISFHAAVVKSFVINILKNKMVLEYFDTQTKYNLQQCTCQRDANIFIKYRQWKPTKATCTKYWVHKYNIRPFFSSFNFLTKWHHNLRVPNVINDILSFTHTCRSTSHTSHIMTHNSWPCDPHCTAL